MNRAVDADLDFKIRILKQSPVFAAAADDDIAELARVAKVAAVQRGKPLVKKGQEGTQIFVVQSGVGCELQSEPADDRALLIGMFGPGAITGAAAALLRGDGRRGDPDEDDEHPKRWLEALTNMSVLAAPAADFFRVCRRSDDLSFALSKLLAAENEDLARLYAQSIHHTLEMRLAGFFARITALSASDDWNPVTNIGKLSQSAVATLLGVSREHVNRTLAMWERSGLIFQNKKGEILVQNAKRLAHLTGPHTDHGASEKQEDWLWEIDAHLDRGLNQTALHLALEAAKRAPKDLRYAHRAVLATARMGAISEALGLIDKWKLGKDPSDEELACLRPRLTRDLAFAETADKPNARLLAESARDYEKVFNKTHGFYPGINAAAGHALAGDAEKAKSIAGDVWGLLAADDFDGDDEENYWRRTTRAECKLLQGDKAAAASLFEAASNAEDATHGKKATTRKQLRRLRAATGIDDAWIDRVSPQPAVLFFSGPLARDVQDDAELPSERLLDELDAIVSERNVGYAYGALASGADIVIAEALIEAGVALNVYLPLPPAEFLKSSVQVGGPAWKERFANCMRAAAAIEWNRRAKTACNATYRLGAEIAMGKAARHATQLETDAVGFFATQKNRDASLSLSVANAELWKSCGLAAAEVADEWPGKAAAAAAAKADANGNSVFFALVIQTGGAKAPKSLTGGAAHHLIDDAAGVEILLYPEISKAVEEAIAYAASAAGRKAPLWLDAGVFPTHGVEKSPAKATEQLVTASCRPLTEAGKVFASEPLACVAPLAPSLKASFEYIGFAPTKEKLDPCALYLVQA